jgi:hypothetical protein
VNEAEFQAQFRPGSTLAAVLAKARVPDRAEQEEKLAAKAAEAARAARNEELALANQAAGNPLAELSRAQTAVGMARDAVRDLEAQLREAREVLSRAEGNVAVWSGQVEELQADVARRSSVEGDLLSPAKQAHQEFVQATRAAFEAVQAGKPRQVSRPFRGGEVVRSHLECIYCQREHVDPETSALLHLDPQHNVPITTAADEAALVASGHRDQAERRTYSYTGEISR